MSTVVARRVAVAALVATGKHTVETAEATLDMTAERLGVPGESLAVTRQSPGGRSLTYCCCDRTTARLVVCPTHPDATSEARP